MVFTYFLTLITLWILFISKETIVKGATKHTAQYVTIVQQAE
jgi:hypothetical protein